APEAFPRIYRLPHPRMFATAQVLQLGDAEAIFVPSQAVINDPATNSSRGYVIEGDVAHTPVVKIGGHVRGQVRGMEDGMVRITSGLSGGETALTNNFNQLFDGAKTIMANLQRPTKASPSSS